MRGRHKNPDARTGKAFTLVELLVVMSIIAILLALLLPTIRRAKEQSNRIICQKNLRDIWNGVVVYSTEFNDRIPFLVRGDVADDPFDPKNPQAVGVVLGPYVGPRAFICPSAVAGYPDRDPNSRRRWKLTYDFSTADRLGGPPIPYDDAQGAFTGLDPDPAVVKQVHFDGRPMRTLDLPTPQRQPNSPTPPQPAPPSSRTQIEVVSSQTVPLVADALAVAKALGQSTPRFIYPHRGLIRRQSEYTRQMSIGGDPRLVNNRTHGYLQLHLVMKQPDIILTRYDQP